MVRNAQYSTADEARASQVALKLQALLLRVLALCKRRNVFKQWAGTF